MGWKTLPGLEAVAGVGQDKEQAVLGLPWQASGVVAAMGSGLG